MNNKLWEIKIKVDNLGDFIKSVADSGYIISVEKDYDSDNTYTIIGKRRRIDNILRQGE